MATQTQILFVLDNPKDETALREALASFYQLEFSYDPDQTLEMIEDSTPAVVVLSFRQDLISPLAIAHVLRNNPRTPYIGLIYISHQEANEWLDRAIMAGVDICLPEGRTMLETKSALESVLRLRSAKHEVQHINASFNSAYQRFRTLSPTDDVLGLGNHHFLSSQLRIEFRRAQRYQKNLVLLLVRIDSLSGTETLSPTQEKLLSTVAYTISSSVRFEIDYTGRSRDAEFFVILPETDIDGAISIAERIRTKISKLHISPNNRHLATSVGVAHFNGDRGNFGTFEEFLNTAYIAVKSAQQHGGDQYWALDTSAEEIPEERMA